MPLPMFLLAPVTSATFPSNGFPTAPPRSPGRRSAAVGHIRVSHTQMQYRNAGERPPRVGSGVVGAGEHALERGDGELDGERETTVTQATQLGDHPGHLRR